MENLRQVFRFILIGFSKQINNLLLFINSLMLNLNWKGFHEEWKHQLITISGVWNIKSGRIDLKIY